MLAKREDFNFFKFKEIQLKYQRLENRLAVKKWKKKITLYGQEVESTTCKKLDLVKLNRSKLYKVVRIKSENELKKIGHSYMTRM